MRKARPKQGEGHALNLKPNPFQIFLYLFFELVALCEHSAKFGGQAVHLISKRFVVLLFFFNSNVAAGGEDVILGSDLFCGGNCAEAFYIFEGALLRDVIIFVPSSIILAAVSQNIVIMLWSALISDAVSFVVAVVFLRMEMRKMEK